MSESLINNKGVNPSKDAIPSTDVKPPVHNSNIGKWNRAIDEQLHKDPEGEILSTYSCTIIPDLDPECVKQLQENRSPIDEWNKEIEKQEQTYWKRQGKNAEES